MPRLTSKKLRPTDPRAERIEQRKVRVTRLAAKAARKPRNV